ncbi:hypothetical protein Poly30_29360 [Planctomycetes bacterium Poly30]|uniref:FG-GAP repeat protein n=1 Tax=Saltatorellus ferox TaxID=2528018 RepID=A0A518ETK7_9BACT|nr:hypothetical protein Poly30_29360 [Planctomycetes bacterium Poly30]
MGSTTWSYRAPRTTLCGSFQGWALLASLPQVPNSLEQVLTGDLDGDGIVDLLVPGRSFFRGLGGGTLAALVPVQGSAIWSTLVELIDMDADGDLDLLVKGGPGTITNGRWAWFAWSFGRPACLPLASASSSPV